MKKRIWWTMILFLFLILGSSIVAFAAEIPGAPTDLVARKYGTGRVELKWTAVPGATGYQVYYAFNKEKWKKLGAVSTYNQEYIFNVPDKTTVKAYVVALNGVEASKKSKEVTLKMSAKALPGYPNFPVHPEFTYDKDGALKSGGVWTYIYSVSRVGEDFATTYYEKVLKADGYTFLGALDTIERSFVGSGDKRFGDFRDDAVFYYYRSYKETYVISRHHVVGTKLSEDYFSVTKLK